MHLTHDGGHAAETARYLPTCQLQVRCQPSLMSFLTCTDPSDRWFNVASAHRPTRARARGAMVPRACGPLKDWDPPFWSGPGLSPHTQVLPA